MHEFLKIINRFFFGLLIIINMFLSFMFIFSIVAIIFFTEYLLAQSTYTYPFINELLFILEIVVCYIYGLMSSRLILRMIPQKIEKRKYTFFDYLLVLFTTTITLITLVYLLSLTNQIIYKYFIFIFIYLSVFIIVLKKNYFTNYFERGKVYILFLRRFNTFSDKSLIISINKVLPQNVSIAYLLPQQYKLSSWDPFINFISGFSIFNPLRKMPTFFSSSNSTWKKDVEELIKNADKIIIDISESSDSMLEELQMITTTNSIDKTLFLYDNYSEDYQRLLNSYGIDEKKYESRIVDYSKSWLNAFPRMFIGFLLSYLSIFVFEYAFYHIFFNIDRTNYVLSLAFFIFTVFIYLTIFHKPLIPNSSKHIISYKLLKLFELNENKKKFNGISIKSIFTFLFVIILSILFHRLFLSPFINNYINVELYNKSNMLLDTFKSAEKNIEIRKDVCNYKGSIFFSARFGSFENMMNEMINKAEKYNCPTCKINLIYSLEKYKLLCSETNISFSDKQEINTKTSNSIKTKHLNTSFNEKSKFENEVNSNSRANKYNQTTEIYPKNLHKDMTNHYTINSSNIQSNITYNDMTNYFSIELPNGWIKNEKAQFGIAKITEFSPPNEIGKITGPKIRIRVEKTTESLDQYVNINYNRINRVLNNFTLIENKSLIFKEYPCYKIQYTWFKPPWYEIKTISYTFLIGNKIFEFILTGTIKNVDNAFSSFYTSLMTFKLIHKDGYSKKYSKLSPSVKLWVMKPAFSTFASEKNLKGFFRSTINRMFTKIKIVIASTPFPLSCTVCIILVFISEGIMSLLFIIVVLNDLYYFNIFAILGTVFDWFKVLFQLFLGSIGFYF